MKKIIIFIIALAISTYTFSQVTFAPGSNTNYSDFPMQGAELGPTRFAFAIWQSQNLFNSQSPSERMVIITDENGNLIRQRSLPTDTSFAFFLRNIFYEDNKLFVISLFVKYGSPPFQSTFSRISILDTSLNILSEKDYQLNDSSYFGWNSYSCLFNDRIYTIDERITGNIYQRHPQFNVYDLNGDLLVRKELDTALFPSVAGGDDYTILVSDITTNNVDKLYLPVFGTKINDSIGAIPINFASQLLILDTALNFVEAPEYGCVDANCQRTIDAMQVKIDYYNGNIIAASSASGPASGGSDQNVVVSYQSPLTSGSFITPSYVNILADSLTSLLTKKYTGRKNIADKNNKIFFVGHDFYDNFSAFSTEKNTLVVACMDSSLNTSWTRRFGGDAYYIPSNIFATSDGGCIILARRYDNNFPANGFDHYIFKLAGNGDLAAVNNLNFPSAIKVFPNPANSYVLFDLNQEDNYTVYIIDLNGRNVIQKTFKGRETKIDINPLPQGVYNYRILCNQIGVYSGLLLKK